MAGKTPPQENPAFLCLDSRSVCGWVEESVSFPAFDGGIISTVVPETYLKGNSLLVSVRAIYPEQGVAHIHYREGGAARSAKVSLQRLRFGE